MNLQDSILIGASIIWCILFFMLICLQNQLKFIDYIKKEVNSELKRYNKIFEEYLQIYNKYQSEFEECMEFELLLEAKRLNGYKKNIVDILQSLNSIYSNYQNIRDNNFWNKWKWKSMVSKKYIDNFNNIKPDYSNIINKQEGV